MYFTSSCRHSISSRAAAFNILMVLKMLTYKIIVSAKGNFLEVPVKSVALLNS